LPPINKIVLHTNVHNLDDSSVAFAYEQQRVKELGENINKFRDTGPHSEVDPHDPRLKAVINQHKVLLEDEDTEIENWATLIKTVSILGLGLMFFMILFALIFGFIIIIKVHSNVLLTLSPIPICLFSSVWMIYFAIIGSKVSNLNDHESPVFSKFFKLCCGSIFLFLVQLGVMSLFKPVPELFSSFKDLNASEGAGTERKSQAFFSLGYFISWAFCIINISLVGLETTFAVLLRRHIQRKAMHELQHSTLPLGYQIFGELKCQEVE